jgi:hypothetical protein
MGPIATLIRGLRLPSSAKQSVRDVTSISASVSENDDLGPTNLHRAMRNLSDQKNIDNNSVERRIDRPQQSESNDAKNKLRILQEIEGIYESLQTSNTSLPPDVQQIKQGDKDLLGIEDILKVLQGKNAPTGAYRVTTKEIAAVEYVKYEEPADVMDIKAEELAGITCLNDEEFDDLIDVVESKKQSKMNLYALLDMDENADALLCPQCDSPCDEDDMKDFGKCTFCRQKDLRDPSVHRIQYSDFSSYSNDAKSTTRSSGAPVPAPDQRFLMDKQRKERQERLTSLPTVVNEPKSQPAAVLLQPKSVIPQKAVDSDKVLFNGRKFEETMQPIVEPIQQNQMYTANSEERSDERQRVQLRDKAFKALFGSDEDPYSNSQEEHPGTADFSERLEALERTVENLEEYAYRDIDNIKKDLSQVMSVSPYTHGINSPDC